MTPLQPIHIIGAGISGLTLARCFKIRGIASIIYEKNPSPSHHNYGISLQPWACRLLVKVLDIDEMTFVRRVAVDGVREGRGRVYGGDGGDGGGGGRKPLRAHRGRLEGLLREEINVKWGHALQHISPSSDESGKGHTLTFSNEEKVHSNLIVDTSGVHSPIRKALLPDVKLNVLPYVVFRGTRRVEGEVFGEVYGKFFNDANVIEIKLGEIVLQVAVNDYVPDSQGGGVDISYIYSRPSRADDLLHRPGRELDQSSNISETFFAEVSKLSGLEGPFRHAFDVEGVRRGRTLHWLMREVIVPKEELGACFAVRDAVELAGFVGEGKSEGGGGIDLSVDVEGFYGRMFGEWVDGVRAGEESLREMHSEGLSNL
ncbi:hypothetical protein BKA65DRAFT_572474 [Rhexocercosporidium sp. MPI-PUGE-AT-0058]|nr:hypothetical protein BKA65DRAFT_572474 [Rhexocercosporidium sp. MPI-PUGE-AT-0058]